MQFFSLMANFK